jgi:hypothetical protein
MRTIRQSGQFKRDLKRESKGQHRKILQEELWPSLPRWALTNRSNRATVTTRSPAIGRTIAIATSGPI